MTYADVVAMYERFKEPPAPIEPIKLTCEQRDWMRQQVTTLQPNAYELAPLLGVPIHLVEDAAESTPVQQQWNDGWPGVTVRLPGRWWYRWTARRKKWVYLSTLIRRMYRGKP